MFAILIDINTQEKITKDAKTIKAITMASVKK